MNLLALDCGTDQMSLAVQTRAGAVHAQQGAGGAQTSATLIPTLLALLQQAGLTPAALDAICFGAGPGSFTGLRTACAVAQGLGFGAGVPVLAVESLLALAEAARHQALPASPRCRVTALLDARMDEIYCASFAWAEGGWTRLQEDQLLRPEQLAGVLACLPAPAANEPWICAGNAFEAYGARLGSALPARHAAVPTASALLRLAPALLRAGHGADAAQALPRYVRDKVAQTTAERAALRSPHAQ